MSTEQNTERRVQIPYRTPANIAVYGHLTGREHPSGVVEVREESGHCTWHAPAKLKAVGK
jgi:hypothetical protein